jgi:hypothetical protein
MNLIIKIENGKPVNHPLHEDNMKFFYPDLDVDNPPEGYARFVRKLPPELDPMQRLGSSSYVIDEELTDQYGTTVWTDQYEIIEVTDEELIQEAQETTRRLNEKMATDVNAPVPPPDDGNLYVWSSITNSWLVKPDNFDNIVNNLANKLYELGVAGMTPEEIQNLEPEKRQAVQEIIDEINQAFNANIINESNIEWPNT